MPAANDSKVCPLCGISFTPTNTSKAVRARRKFCSRKCADTPEPLSDRFWRHIDKTADCWLWKAAVMRNGYGKCGVDGRTEVAHRVAWVLTHGAIPDGLFILHRCDVRLCCNPAHLFLGTTQDNTADREKKGRTRTALMKLTPAKVLEIRERLCCGIPDAIIAADFSVSAPLIRLIRLKQAWKWL